MRRLPVETRFLLALSSLLAPRADRTRWRASAQSRLDSWWYYNSAVPGARSDLLRESLSCVRDAYAARSGGEDGEEGGALRRAIGHPLAIAALLLTTAAALAWLSSGFRETRAWMHTGGDRLVLISARSTFAGHALGVPSSRFLVWPKYQTSLQQYSGYVWHQTDDGRIVAAVQPSFFALTGTTAVAGHLFGTENCMDCAVSRNPQEIGRSVMLIGRLYRVVGAVPRNCRFGPVRPSYWIPLDLGHLPPRIGVVAELRTEISEDKAQHDLGAAVAPLSYLGRETLLFYTVPLLLAIGLALFRITHDRAFWAHTSGRFRDCWKFWAFYLIKTALALVIVALTAVELRYAVSLTSTGAREPAFVLLATWPMLIAYSATLWWTWVDQRLRCRTCQRRLELPVHMGVLGESLSGPAGIESVCPVGHGALYLPDTSMSDATWITLDEFFSTPAK